MGTDENFINFNTVFLYISTLFQYLSILPHLFKISYHWHNCLLTK